MGVAILGNYPEDKNKILGGTHAAAWNLAEGLSRLPKAELHAITFVPGVRATRHRVCNGVYEHHVASTSTLGGLPSIRLIGSTWPERPLDAYYAAEICAYMEESQLQDYVERLGPVEERLLYALRLVLIRARNNPRVGVRRLVTAKGVRRNLLRCHRA